MSTGDVDVFRAFAATIDQLQAMHAAVSLRPREISMRAAFDGDYDFLFDPDRLAEIIAAAVAQCRRFGVSVIIEQHAPYKRRICFICDDPERRIQIELWPHAELSLSNGSMGALAAIPWKSARPFFVSSDRYLALRPPVAAAIYLTHLHHKQKALSGPEVQRRLAYYEDALSGSDAGSDEDLLGTIQALRAGTADLKSANMRACSALLRMGVPVRILRLAPRLQRARRRLARAVAGKDDVALTPVPILGPDGSGKTALIGALADRGRFRALKFKNVFRTSLVYRGSLSVKARNANAPRMARNRIDENMAQAILTIALLRWWPLVIPRMVRRYFRNGPATVVDRYFWDYLVKVRGAGARPSPIAGHRLFSKLVPTPHEVVVLCCGLDTLYSRKQELSAAAIDCLYDLYCDQIARKRVKHVLMLSTDGSFDRSYGQLAWFLMPDGASKQQPSSARDRGRSGRKAKAAGWATDAQAGLDEARQRTV
jgi:hypothetical protein